MTRILTGYERTTEIHSRAIGRGKFRRPPTIAGTGLGHAVVEGSDTALCGATVVWAQNEWPAGLGRKCQTCVEAVAEIQAP
jgi:hypothetical protein